MSAQTASEPVTFRVLHLNSLLTGGGTDDQCAKLALGLRQLGHSVWVAGPDGREFSRIIRELGVPFHATPLEGPLKLNFIRAAARFIRREKIQIVHGHNGRDLWPTILAARLSGVRPKIVLTRHMAKSPSSWFSRRFLLGQCDALIAVSEFVAKVLREGVLLRVTHLIVQGEWAVVELEALSTALNGMPFANRYCWVCRFAGQTIVEVRAYLDSALVARLLVENEAPA